MNLKGKVAEVALNEAASVVIEKDGAAGKALITVAKPGVRRIFTDYPVSSS